MRYLNIGYFADGPWSHLALERIIADESLKVSFICARYDSPDPILRELANKYKITFLTHPNVNSDEFIDLVSLFKYDIFVSMSFNQIFQSKVIDLPPEKTINCHAGKLPFYRGRNVLNWVIINDELEFGITVHYVDKGIDSGDIILQKTYPITDDDNYHSVLKRAYEGCAEVLYQSIKLIQNGKAVRIQQKSIHPIGFYCSSRKEGDEVIDWSCSSRSLFNFVRAICTPGPQARTFCNGHEVKINKVDLVQGAPHWVGIPGAILKMEGRILVVKTIDSFVKVVDWSGGVKIRVGDRFK
jgi:methionyl-tRNA formyltransferase